MRSLLVIAFAALGCLAFVPRLSNTIERVRWLAGCWEAKDARRSVYEQWTVPHAHSMLGTGRTIRGDSLVEYELTVLRERGERLAYEAHPSGRASTTFLSTLVSDSAVTFENLQHDFPQKVGYERHGADSLVAWISGPRGAVTRKIVFPYKRVACE